ncbi:MAG: 2-oxo-4-hydroxy-4-carboxy-5-ureidoimidazoline decarboxylase, partial [Pseudomonadota bacterium]
ISAIDGEPEEVEAQRAAFAAYESQFGFPYLAILDAEEPLPQPDELTQRLDNDSGEERMFALRYVSEEARERLENLFG